MAISDVEAVLEFLRKNGLSESESALMEDILEKSHLGSSDFERFLFPMVPPPPPLRIPAARRLPEVSGGVGGGGGGAGDCSGSRSSSSSSSSSSQEEFVSLASSTTELSSSDFTNPYGIRTTSRASSQASSDRMSQFGTARDYPDFDMQNDLFWYKEKDEEFLMPPLLKGSDTAIGPSEDKFVMTIETGKQSESQLCLNHIGGEINSHGSSDNLDEQWPLTIVDGQKDDVVKDNLHVDKEFQCEEGDNKGEGGDNKGEEGCMFCSCQSLLFACCGGAGRICGVDPADGLANVKLTNNCDNEYRPEDERHAQFDTYYAAKRTSIPDRIDKYKTISDIEDYPPNETDIYRPEDYKELVGEPHEPDGAADEEDVATSGELQMYETNEDDYDIFHLRIIHRKNRTGFEENKDLPIVLNGIIAARYYVTEYLGSAAFSKVVQAHDLHTGVDVCLKIIKNDKDFFDQSLDEIKLLKYVNKHDPGDEHHILRLYDYFYHQEHLFIVCELLRANLYEFQKYNRESGGEPYFTLSRLQVITRQCLEALEFLHGLGVIHCDLKPENILIKSYRRCEIKIIDLGSSCFEIDNLSLYVQSRSYRAPEVILGLPYNQKIDLWSLGCILAELCSGEVLFPNEAIVTLLARMVGMLGPIDMDMLLNGQETHKYFTREFDLYHINEEINQLEYIIPEDSSLENHLQVSDPEFIDFVKYLLQINPQRRPTAWEALQHPWLSCSYEFDTC